MAILNPSSALETTSSFTKIAYRCAYESGAETGDRAEAGGGC